MSLSLSTTPFSFHCTICFEPFDQNERPPVILPCGHTFLCALCSKRLKRCMECRTSLFITPPPSSFGRKSPPPSPIYQRRRYPTSPNSRYRHDPETVKPPPPREDPIPLPLPKNLLLLTLMEAAEREATAKRSKTKGGTGMMIRSSPYGTMGEVSLAFSYSEESLDEEEEEDFGDDEKVRAGVAAVSGACGTYAVAEKEGLRVSSEKPEGFGEVWSKEANRQRGFRKSNSLLIDADGVKSVEVEEEVGETMSLDYGVRVQVVDIQGGWAKLARNRGYVLATSSQLVKVDGPHDSACQIEGLLYSVTSRKQEVHAKVDELDRIEKSLTQDLGTSLLEPYPIFTKPSFHDSPTTDQRNPTSPSKTPERQNLPSAPSSPCRRDDPTPSLPVSLSPPSSPRSPPILSRRTNTERHVEFSDRTDFVPPSPSDEKHAKRLEELESRSVGCTPFFRIPDDPHTDDGEYLGVPVPEGLCDHPRFRIRSNSWRRTNNESPSRACVPNQSPGADQSPGRTLPNQSPGANRSPDRHASSFIDFRTGMSGHMGLMSTRAHEGKPKRGPIKMMGEHKGLARIRRIRRQDSNQDRIKGSQTFSEGQKSPNLSTFTW